MKRGIFSSVSRHFAFNMSIHYVYKSLDVACSRLHTNHEGVGTILLDAKA